MIALFHRAVGDDVVGPLHYLMLAWGFVDPNTEATILAGIYQRASASGSLTGPCQKLLLAIFQLPAFIVVCLADLWAVTCHSSDVMCASSSLSRAIILCISGCNYFCAACRVGGSCTMGQSQWGDFCADCHLLCILGKLPGLSKHQFFCRGTGKKEASVCPKLL